MGKYIIKRILGLIPVLLLVSIFSYFIIQAAPGDPVDNYVRPGMTQEQIEAVKEEYGLNGNIVEQYLNWLKHVLQGDLGTSIYKH
ncbi:MAG: ABC transporter permease, partial [Ruminococcus sp.]|nr:ABC transporter permease [Ruminococcus sp.]